MKQRILHTAMAAAMAAAALTITACAEHDAVINPTTEEPTATVQKITVSFDDATDTRAVNPATGKKTFAEGDQIGVFHRRGAASNLGYAPSNALGVGDISSDGKSATFTVGFTSTPMEDGKVFYVYPAGMAKGGTFQDENITNSGKANSKLINWTNLYSQSGKIDGNSGLNEHDLATFYGQLNGRDLPATAKLENQLAILELTVVDGTGTDVTATLTELKATIASTTYRAVGADTDGKIYMAVPPISTATDIVFTATNGKGTATTDDDVVLTKTVKDVTLDRNTITPVTLTAYQQTVNLDGVTTTTGVEDVSGVPTLRLHDGQVITGSLIRTDDAHKVKVTIADGATVTLSGVTIDGKAENEDAWAGITCEGDATILLTGTNTVTNFDSYYPAIFVPSGKTLTIGGTGSLTASNTYYLNGNASIGSGAAIGGGYGMANGMPFFMACGNIAITGGTVTANGGAYCAAIGGGYGASCGSITISGGTVKATANASYGGAGIGSGNNAYGNSNATCGDITISGTANVTATGGNDASGIGCGNSNECGDISISGACIVNATGGDGGAGIGTGSYAKCGDVTITGGTVTAKGGNNAAGIGCGKGGNDGKSECGDITIECGDGFTIVTAIKGQGEYNNPIGQSTIYSDWFTCGTITFANDLIFNDTTDDKWVLTKK